MGSIITAQGVTKTFGNQLVLRDISLTINEGEFVSIVGASGSGKTTLLYLSLIHISEPTRPY